MGNISKIEVFSTIPEIDPDIGTQLDTCIQRLYDLVNGAIDNVNIAATPKISSSKIDLTGTGYVQDIGDEITGTLEHVFSGIWRKMVASGNARLREYNSVGLWGIVYNTQYSTGAWQGRDVTGICLRIELDSNGLHLYYAVSAASAVVPTWTEILHVDISGIVQVGSVKNYENATVTTVDLKTSLGSVNYAVNATGGFHAYLAYAATNASYITNIYLYSAGPETGTNLTLPGGEYGFYPQVLKDGNSYPTAQQRYVTASGKDHWIFILYDTITNQIAASWEAPDHPCYGQGGDETEIPHPFADYFNKPLPANLKIILLDNAQIDELKAKRTRKKGILEIIATEYEIDFTSQPQYKTREIIEIDEYGDKKGVIIKGNLKRREVEILSSMIEYRKLKIK